MRHAKFHFRTGYPPHLVFVRDSRFGCIIAVASGNTRLRLVTSRRNGAGFNISPPGACPPTISSPPLYPPFNRFFSSAQQKGARAPPPPPNMNTNTNTNTNIFPEARETRFPRFRDTNRSCDSAPAAINEGRAVNCSRLRRISERSLSPDLKLFLPSAIITIDDECQDDRTTPFHHTAPSSSREEILRVRSR